MTNSIEIRDVSDTAVWVAHFRAEESARPDALFKDPYAKNLVGEKGKQIAQHMGFLSTRVQWTLIMRTRIIDQMILKMIEEGVDTIVNLGAGLDTRPYRMNLPSHLQWIEVDYPNIISHKQNILKSEEPSCRLEQISLDLAEKEKRQKLFSDINAKAKNVLILTEGVIPYLTEEQVAELSKDLLAQMSFQFWIAEYFHPHMYRYLQGRKRMKHMRNAPFLFFPKDWLGFFKSNGWIVKEARYLAEESIQVNRPIPMPWWARILIPLMKAETIKERMKATGFMIFKRG